MQPRSQSVQDQLKLNLQSKVPSESTTDMSAMAKKLPSKQSEQIQNRIPEDVQKAPKQVFDFFTAESMVKRMVNDGMYPVLIKFPSVERDIKQLQTDMRFLQGAVKKQEKEIKTFQDLGNQLREQEKLVKNFEQTFRTNCNSIQEHLNKQDVTTNSFNNKFEEIYKRMIDDKKVLDKRFRILDDKFYSLDDKQNQFFKRIDDIISTINSDRQGIEKKMLNYDNEVNTLKYLTDQVRSDFKQEMKNVLEEVSQKRQKDQLKLFKVTQEIKDLKLNKQILDMLEKQVQECLVKQNDHTHTARFISKNLPILMHLQICEALDQVVGETYPRQLLNYEKMKNKILKHYMDIADDRCIRYLNEKLPVFMRYMFESELGCLPFVYGDDIYPGMSEEMRQHIDQTQIIRIRKRYDDIMIGQQNIADAANFLIKDGGSNAQLVEYKLKKLTRPAQIFQLRDTMFEHKVMKKKLYEDYDIWNFVTLQEGIDMLQQQIADVQTQKQPSTPFRNRQSQIEIIDTDRDRAQQSRRDQSAPTQAVSSPSNNSREVSKKTSSMNMAQIQTQPKAAPKRTGGGGRGGPAIPEKMFLIRTEVAKPYFRFEAKFLKLFSDCFANFETFKKKNVKNFADQAEVLAEIGVQIEGVREQITDIQDQVEENDSKQFEDTLSLKKEAFDKLEVIEKTQADHKFQIDQMEHSQIGTEKLLQEVQNKLEDHLIQYKVEMNKFFSSLKQDSIQSQSVMNHQIKGLKSEISSLQNKLHEQLKKDIEAKIKQQQIMQQLSSGINMQFLNQKLKTDKADLEQKIIDKAAETEELIKTQTTNKISSLVQQFDSTQNIIEITDLGQQFEKEEQAEINKNLSTLPQPPGTSHTLSPPGQKKVSMNRSMGVTGNLKQAEKNRLQRQQEEKRKKAEQVQQKQIEREERAEILKREREMKEIQFQKQLDKEENYKKQLEERKKQQEERRQRKEKFQSNTKALVLSNNFVSKLKKQEKQDSKQADNLLLKSNQLIGLIQQKMTKTLSEKSESKKSKEKTNSRVSTAKPEQVQENTEEEAAAYNSESDGEEEQSNDTNIKPAINMDKLYETINEKIGQSKIEIIKYMIEKLGKSMIPLEHSVKEFKIQIKEMQNSQKDSQDIMHEKMDSLREDYNEYKKNSCYKINQIEEQLNSETYGIRKLKGELKGEVKKELCKLEEFTINSNYEFTRINTFIVNTQLILNSVIEDLMLQQLIQEQDVQDRQNIGMFGVKKNADTIGMNQGGSSNHITKSPIKKNEGLRSDFEWDMQNKNKNYRQVTKEKPLKNEKQAEIMAQQLSSMQPIQDGAIGSSDLRSNSEVIQSNNNNVLTVSRECASCYGFAPLILSQIKMACLSYTSSPIKYTDGCSLSVTDVIKIKQAVIKNMEWTIAELSQFLVFNKSKFKILPMQQMIYDNKKQKTSKTVTPHRGNSSQKINAYQHYSGINSQTHVPFGMLNRGSDPQLESNSPVHQNYESRQSQMSKNDHNTQNMSDGDQTIPNSDEYKYRNIDIDGMMQPLQESNGIVPELVIGTLTPVKAWYLNPELKYNIPSVTQLMLYYKDMAAKKSSKQQTSKNPNYPTFKIENQDLEEIMLKSQNALQSVHVMKNQNFVRIRSDQFKIKSGSNTDHLNTGRMHPSKSPTSTEYNPKTMTLRVNIENQKYQKMQDTLVDKQYEQLLTKLKEEQDSKSQGNLYSRAKQSNMKFQLVKGKSNQLIQTFSKPTTGSLAFSGENGQFRGLSGSKLAAKRAQSKIESKSYMTRRQSRGGSNVRGTTKVSSDHNESLEQQGFPQVEYQHQLYRAMGAPRSHFSTRTGSQSKATMGYVTNNINLNIDNHKTMNKLGNHANSRTIETYASGNTNFLSQIQLDANNNRQVELLSGQLSPPGTVDNNNQGGQFEPLLAPTSMTKLGPQTTPHAQIPTNQDNFNQTSALGGMADTEHFDNKNKSEFRIDDFQMLKIDKLSKLE